MPDEAQLRLLAFLPPVELRVRIGGRGIGVVRPLLVGAPVAASRRLIKTLRLEVSVAIRPCQGRGKRGALGPRMARERRDAGKPQGGDKRSQRIEAYRDTILAAIEGQDDITLVELAERNTALLLGSSARRPQSKTCRKSNTIRPWP